MNINEKLKRNISISYVYNFLFQLNITSAIWVLYLGFKGMSLIEIGLLESIFHITGVLFELPTGAIADVYGKKFSIIAGRILSVVSCIFMIISSNFWGFGLAFVLSAASMNLNSGAGEALIYDSLKELGEEDRYKKIWGNLSSVMSLGQGAAVLLGGVLSDIKFLYAYILGTIIQVGALVISCNFNEPPSHGNEEEKQQKNVILKQVLTSVKVLKTRKLVLYLILFSSLAGSLQTTVFFYSQQYFSDMNYSKTAIAIICATSSLVEAVGSRYAYKFENFLKLEGTLISISLINVFSILGLAFIKDLAIVFFLLSSITGGLAYTIFSDYINSRIPSEFRATILSFDSLSFSVFMISIFPLFGLLAEKIGFSITFGSISFLYIPITVFLLIKIKKLNGTEKVKHANNDGINFK